MSETAIALASAGKMYKIFPTRRAGLLHALGLRRFLPTRFTSYEEFWALRGISLQIGRGERIGVIGRNGAGKTTLLKLITGNMRASEGRLNVRGRVRSLIDVGGGLHPEFTGLENIRASLTYQGLSQREIREAEADIAAFTELGDFIHRPLKTYSMGMQARLAFTIATTINPEILVIDEVLGAGDAYFFGKSISRMQHLVESGATIVIVSHALDQIVRFCDRAVWLDRGQIVTQGSTLDIVKRYEKFIRVLEDRRLSGKNQKIRSNRFKGLQSEGYVDTVIIRATVAGGPGSWLDLSEIRLFKGDEPEDELMVGSPQDGDPSQSAHVSLDTGAWSEPMQEGTRFYRRISVVQSAQAGSQAYGVAKMFCWAFEDDVPYRVETVSRASHDATLFLEVVRNGELLTSANLRASAEWTGNEVLVAAQTETNKATPVAEAPSTPVTAQASELHPPDLVSTKKVGIVNLSRWPGEGSLSISSVHLRDAANRDHTVFTAHEPMRIVVRIEAHKPGVFPLIMASLIFRIDGIVATRHVGPPVELRPNVGDEFEAVLDMGALNLGNGNYVLSIGLYRRLDPDDIEAPQIYDYLDRSFEFQVVGNKRLHNELFRHPGEWFVNAASTERSRQEILRE